MARRRERDDGRKEQIQGYKSKIHLKSQLIVDFTPLQYISYINEQPKRKQNLRN